MTEHRVLWQDTLDAYEARLDATRDAAANGDVVQPPPFQPPAGLDAMPAELVDRASALLVRSRELEAVLTKARSAIAAKLAQPASTPAPAPRRASRLDVSV